jgi:hypothetical protein
MVKAARQDVLATLYVTGRDTLDMELELMFDDETATWQFLGYAGQDRRQRRERLLSEVNELLMEEGDFHGTASELLAKLSARTDLNIKSANALTRQLNPFKSLLHLEYDICYLMERSGKERTLHLTRILNDDSDDTVRPGTDTVTIVTE